MVFRANGGVSKEFVENCRFSPITEHGGMQSPKSIVKSVKINKQLDVICVPMTLQPVEQWFSSFSAPLTKSAAILGSRTILNFVDMSQKIKSK